MVVRQKPTNPKEFYIGCRSYPNCKNVVWFPRMVKTAQVLPETCLKCGPNYNKIQFEFRDDTLSHLYPQPYTACIAGCDLELITRLNINILNIRTVRSTMPGSAAPSRMPNVLCVCKRPAKLERVKQTERTDCLSVNFGKMFYTCSLGKDKGGCKLFLWAPGVGDNQFETSPETHSASQSSSSSGDTPTFSRNIFEPNEDNIQCICELPCKTMTVRKDTPNKGRLYYGCPKNFGSRCNFFQWVDDGSTTTAGRGGGGGGSGNTRGRGRASGSGGGRRCGICRQTGHTRTRCRNVK